MEKLCAVIRVTKDMSERLLTKKKSHIIEFISNN